MASVLQRWRAAEQQPSDVLLQRDLLTSIFEEFGQSHPQKITVPELAACLEQLEVSAPIDAVERVAQIFDEDQDGLLEFDVWLQSILAIKAVCIVINYLLFLRAADHFVSMIIPEVFRNASFLRYIAHSL